MSISVVYELVPVMDPERECQMVSLHVRGIPHTNHLTLSIKHGEKPSADTESQPHRPSRIPSQMDLLMKGASVMMSSPALMSVAERALPAGRLLAGRDRVIGWLPGLAGGWTSQRDLPSPPRQSFRHWWKDNRTEKDAQ